MQWCGQVLAQLAVGLSCTAVMAIVVAVLLVVLKSDSPAVVPQNCPSQYGVRITKNTRTFAT